VGDPLLAVGWGTRRIRNSIDLGHQPFNQHIRLKKGHQCVQTRRPLHGERFIKSDAAHDWPGQPCT
jgi:hypothetical protein